MCEENYFREQDHEAIRSISRLIPEDSFLVSLQPHLYVFFPNLYRFPWCLDFYLNFYLSLTLEMLIWKTYVSLGKCNNIWQETEKMPETVKKDCIKYSWTRFHFYVYLTTKSVITGHPWLFPSLSWSNKERLWFVVCIPAQENKKVKCVIKNVVKHEDSDWSVKWYT